MVYYTAYDQFKMMFGFKPSQFNLVAPLLAGSLARTIAVLIISPFELIRTKLQSREGYSYKELVNVVRGAVRKNGVLSLWRGVSPLLLRDVPFTLFYWVGYEFIKLQLNTLYPDEFVHLVPFVSGSVSGAMAAFLTTPLDVAKTHMQVREEWSVVSLHKNTVCYSKYTLTESNLQEKLVCLLFSSLHYMMPISHNNDLKQLYFFPIRWSWVNLLADRCLGQALCSLS